MQNGGSAAGIGAWAWVVGWLNQNDAVWKRLRCYNYQGVNTGEQGVKIGD